MWKSSFSHHRPVTSAVHTTLLLAAGVVLNACEATSDMNGPGPAPESAFSTANGVSAIVSGAGHFIDIQNPDITWKFTLTALQRDPSGEADGKYHFSGSLDGLAIEFRARVTCMIADPETGRAWIGGVVTDNNSEFPSFRDGAIFQVGQPTWMRVADYGEGENAPEPDRTTRIFFTGSGGFQSAEEFCVSGFWPIVDGVQRITSTLLNGHIQVIVH
jgi:hypothetical protein